jgi:hypothetical protein
MVIVINKLKTLFAIFKIIFFIIIKIEFKNILSIMYYLISNKHIN